MAPSNKEDKKSRNPLLGAAVLRELLRRRSAVDPAPRLASGNALPGPTDGIKALYEGVLRDLGLSDAQVEEYLRSHTSEVEEAIKGHGRRGA
jgi:hypothetical protein